MDIYGISYLRVYHIYMAYHTNGISNGETTIDIINYMIHKEYEQENRGEL